MLEFEIGGSQAERRREENENETNSDRKDKRISAAERLATLKRIVESFSDMVERIGLRASDKGISIQVMDSMHVALSDVFLSKDMFTSYRCDRDVCITVPLKQFVLILKSIIFEPTSNIRFSCDDSPETLRIEHATDDVTHQFDIQLYAVSAENYDVPEMEFNSSITMPVEQFKAITKTAGNFGEYIILNYSNGVFHFNQKGDYTQNSTELRPNGSTIIIDGKEPVNLEIALKYVGLVNKIAPLGGKITIRVGAEAPVFFDMSLYDTLGHVKFYIAPKSGTTEN